MRSPNPIGIFCVKLKVSNYLNGVCAFSKPSDLKILDLNALRAPRQEVLIAARQHERE